MVHLQSEDRLYKKIFLLSVFFTLVSFTFFTLGILTILIGFAVVLTTAFVVYGLLSEDGTDTVGS